MDERYTLARSYVETQPSYLRELTLRALTDAMKERDDPRLFRVEALLQLDLAYRDLKPDYLYPQISEWWRRREVVVMFPDTSCAFRPSTRRVTHITSRSFRYQGMGVLLTCAILRKSLEVALSIPLRDATVSVIDYVTTVRRFLAVREMVACRLLGEPHLESWLPGGSLTTSGPMSPPECVGRALSILRRNAVQAGAYVNVIDSLPARLASYAVPDSDVPSPDFPVTSAKFHLESLIFCLFHRLYEKWVDMFKLPTVPFTGWPDGKSRPVVPALDAWAAGHVRPLGHAREGLVLWYCEKKGRPQ